MSNKNMSLAPVAQRMGVAMLAYKNTKSLLATISREFNIWSIRICILVIAILVPILVVGTQAAYATSSAFNDGSASATLTTTCASPTTIGTLTTSFPGGDNLIIASVQVRSTDGGAETIAAGNLILKEAATLASNQFDIQVNTADTQNPYMLITKQTSAPANPTYTVTGCSSATAVSAEAKIVAFSGITNNVFTDGSSTACAATDTTLATLSSVSSGTNVIIASVQISNGGTAQDIAAGAIKLKNNAGTTIASNEFAISLGTTASTSIQSIVIIAREVAGAAGSYTVTIAAPQACNAEAKAVALQTADSTITDGASTAVGTSSTTLATVSTTYASASEVVVIGTGQFDDTGTAAETYAAATGYRLLESGTSQSTNEFIMRAMNAGGSAADGHRHTLIWRTASSPANPSYTIDAAESANNAQNGEAKIVALRIKTVFTQPLSETAGLSDTNVNKAPNKVVPETAGLSDTNVQNDRGKFALDTAGLSDTPVKDTTKVVDDTLAMTDTFVIVSQFIRSLNESLVMSDTSIRAFSRKVDDTLSLTDAADTPVNRVQTLSDTATLTDTAIKASTKVISEIATFADTIVKQLTQSVQDTITLVDTISAPVDRVQTLSDTSTLSDTLATSIGRVQTLADTLTLTDATSTPVNRVQTLSDTLTFIDDTPNSVSRVQTISDAVALTDATSNTADITRTLSDTITLTDATPNSVSRVQTISDTITMTDSFASSKTETVSDTLALTDSTTKEIATSLADTLTLSEDLQKSVEKLASDILGMVDSTGSGSAFSTTLTESLSSSDAVVTQAGVLITLSETLGMVENVQSESGIIVNLSETLAFTDAIVIEGMLSNSATEAIGLSDTIGLIFNTPCPPASPTEVSCNFLGGSGVVGGGTLTFPSVSAPGTTTIEILSTGPPAPPEFTLIGLGGSTLYYDIDTTASFTGPVKIALTYDDSGRTPDEENAITLQHFNGVSWEDITTSLDTNNNVVSGQTNSFSKFAVMFGASIAGHTGGGGPQYEIIDTVPPAIVSQHYEPTTPFSGNELRVLAKINDDVAITKAYLLYFVNMPEPEFHQVPMVKHDADYFMGTVLASDVRIVGMTYWIFAEDFGGNAVQSAVQNVEIKQSTQVVIPPKPSQKNLPSHVLEAIKPKIAEPVEKIEVLSMNSGSEINTFTDTIIIRNTGNRTADNIRIMLSPEISKSFKLSDLSIKSIAPNENVTITLEVNGNPNKDMLGGLVGYSGNLIVMAEHFSPITLPVNIGAEESTYKDEYMDKVAAMAEQRYNKISLLNSILTKQDRIEHDYEVTTSDGDRVITNPSDEIVIKNLSEKQLKNVRIYLNNAGNAFLLEHRNIQTLEPNGQVSIKLIPRMDSEKYSPKDIKGELLIVPSNDNPMLIPIDIVREERKDSADEFEIRTLSGNDGIFTAHDKIVIKNLGNRPLDSVRLMLPVDLARVFMLSNDSFKNIAPNSEVTIDLKFREEPGAHRMGLLQNYQGELAIVSEHHRAKVIPINITWNEISSEHFLIYSRNSESDIAKAKDLITYLEFKYQNVTSRFGEMEAKTKIYMTNTLEEFRMIAGSGHSYYAFSDNVIFICGCDEDVKSLAMKELVYRIAFNKYPNYSNKEKFMLDGKNWLMDGISNYVASNITSQHGVVNNQLEAFKTEPMSFVWYGSASEERYGAAYTFFEYLHDKYGDEVIDRTLYYLGSVMVSNHRCDTLEDCAVLRAVYDASGLDMNEKRNTLDVETLTTEWQDYVTEHYSTLVPKQDE